MSDRAAGIPSVAALVAQDSAARARALDTDRSFLVQAPAGSGKTELLIQRYLALLARVDQPERIVAMTFTRKAAGEMRERIVAALRDAAAGTAVDTPHAQRTRDLALAVLAQDARQQWQLGAHPARLQVHTIDALCADLARQAPLATKLGAAPRYEERAEPLYAEAARNALMAARTGDPAWQRLLAHLDNDASRAVELLGGMLARRDQWLGELLGRDAAAFRAAVEATLAVEIAGELAALRSAFPPRLAAALVELERHAAGNLAPDPQAGLLVRALVSAANAGGVPTATIAQQAEWEAVADWLLYANDAAFLKTMNVRKGFPPKGTGAGAAERDACNTAVKALLAELAAEPGLATLLDVARRLPPPRHDDEAWAVVAALLAVLPQVAAQLTLTFRAHGVLDFVQGTIAALDALGTADEPTDLLLRLDLRLEHLLVDEFQDTSYTQLELIRRLTAGWQPDGGRTLFAVGDPMQSVYRFRQAEVRLFVEAQEHRCIGDIPVECLILRRNFRSQAHLVDWVNATFPQVLGMHSDPWRSVVAFAAATPVHRPLPGPAVTVEACADARAEATAVIGRIRAALAAGANDVAVLVRARTHLETLLPALRAAAIPFAAVELDALSARQAILDLVALTHALAQPGDRLAWLAVLRAPWCGLGLPDLFALSAAAEAQSAASLAAMLATPESVAGLTADGQERLTRAARALVPALASRGRASLAARVRGAWLALGGPACVEEAIDLNAAERFFALAADHEMAGEIADWTAFTGALAKLFAEPDTDPATRVQVMTLHRAKGLQFDAVILPGAARTPNRSGVELLRWRRRPRGLLLAPLKASGGEDDSIYAYLRRLAAGEEDAELGRLLYVGCTRARQRLHITGVLGTLADASGRMAWQPPAAGTALAKLWPAVAVTIPVPDTASGAVVDAAVSPTSPAFLSRVPAGWVPPPPSHGVPMPLPRAEAATREILPFDWARETARHLGTVAHRLFAQVAVEGLAAWTPARVTAQGPRIRAELRGEGVDEAELETAARQVAAAMLRLLGDTRGHWLFSPEHQDQRSEWALAGVEDDATVHVVIDRTFVADGVRWIVDFKTGTHEGADTDAFLDREHARYAPQLDRYARIVRALDARPIRLGLYYPLLGGWREWASPH